MKIYKDGNKQVFDVSGKKKLAEINFEHNGNFQDVTDESNAKAQADIIDQGIDKEIKINTRKSLETKLAALGLTEAEIKLI